MSHIYGWICIGLAAAFAAWIWPFRRGLLGLTVNAALGVAGAVGAALFAVGAGLLGSQRDPAALPIAAAGAVGLLCAAHLVWHMAHPTRRHREAHR
jgi:hypothetical protein